VKRIEVKTSKKYEVICGNGVVDTLPEELLKITKAARIMVVTDSNVAPLYLDKIVSKLDKYDVKSVVLNSGERYKNLDSVVDILTALKENDFDRDDLVIALGGGVVGDIAAFSASIYMRGIAFVNIPTTLLAQVDSSVGGKTGVDFMGKKNIVGSFYQPSLVICDTSFLKTLKSHVFSEGCAEIIKYAFIDDEKLYELVYDGIEKNLEEIIPRCIENKNRIVSNDEFDRGQRALLNFGHTIGHATEVLSDYKISHGFAVAIGMYQIAVAVDLKDVYRKIKLVLDCHGLPTENVYPADKLIEAIKSDKKKSGNTINVVIPTGMCKTTVKNMTFDELYDLIKEK